MRSCHIVDFKTPKGFNLHGFFFGPTKPERVVILVHGLAGSAFGGISNLIGGLVDSSTAVFTFNNRGYGIINKLYKDAATKKGYTRIYAGAAHERFEDCVDDIEGAVRAARKLGAKQVILVGHSTGCQKSIYWAAKKGSGVGGIVLLAPMSDYAGTLMLEGKTKMRAAEREARSLVKRGKGSQLLSSHTWPTTLDAQRFLSLYTPESIENSIFPYFDEKRRPTLLKKVRQHLLVILAEKDEYADRPAKQIEGWFAEHSKLGDRIIIVPRATHGFRGAERTLCRAIRDCMDMRHS